MKRIDTATRAIDLFGAGKDGFKDGNLALAIVATDLDAEWFNDVQEELLSVVETAGLVPAPATRTQLRQAIDIMIRKKLGAVCAAGGTADAITGAFTPAYASFTDGAVVYVRAAAENASTTPTFKADALAAKTIVKGNNVPLVGSDIAGAGYWMQLQYDQTLDKFVLLNPASGVKAIGFAQTAQSLIGSRAFSTNYTNTTGRPIYVNVSGSVGTTRAALTIVVNGIAFLGTSAFEGGVAGTVSSAFAIVPPGGVYSASVSAGAVGLLNSWVELR